MHVLQSYHITTNHIIIEANVCIEIKSQEMIRFDPNIWHQLNSLNSNYINKLIIYTDSDEFMTLRHDNHNINCWYWEDEYNDDGTHVLIEDLQELVYI